MLNNNKRALVISGGGSKGSYAGGIVEYYHEKGIDYDILLGSSTGALMVPLIACGEMSTLKHAYTTITNEDVFTRNPFKVLTENNGVFKYKLDYWNILNNIIIHKHKSLGSSSRLREKTIPSFFTKEMYHRMLNVCDLQNKEIAVCVTNFTLKQKEYKDLHTLSYEDVMDWIWASTCMPPFMSIVEKDGYEYVDGGITTMVPLREAILRGADEIDVIVLSEEVPAVNIEKTRNLLHFIINLLTFQMDQRMADDSNPLNLLRYIEKDRIVKINMHYTRRKLTNNALLFETETTSKWWQEGYDYARSGECKTFLVSRNGYQTYDDNTVITTITKNPHIDESINEDDKEI